MSLLSNSGFTRSKPAPPRPPRGEPPLRAPAPPRAGPLEDDAPRAPPNDGRAEEVPVFVVATGATWAVVSESADSLLGRKLFCVVSVIKLLNETKILVLPRVHHLRMLGHDQCR